VPRPHNFIVSVATAVSLATCLCARTAQADDGPVPALGGGAGFNAVDAENAKLATRAAQLGRSPEGVLPLLELWAHWDDSTPLRTRALLEQIAADKALSPSRRVMVQSMLSEARARLGEPEALAQGFTDLGYVTRYRVIGPFDNEGKAGLDAETPPEQKRMDAPDLQASYPGRERPVSWRAYPDISRRGFVSFGTIMRPRENVCGLAETFVYADRARPLSLWIGTGGAHKVYWNGEVVTRDDAYRAPYADRSVVMVPAQKGPNRLLVKVCVASSPWGFFLRVGEADGSPAKALRYELNSTDAIGTTTNTKKNAMRLPAPPVVPLAAFEADAKREPPNAQALANLARYLHETGADDPAEHRAKQLAERAAELAPTLEHLRLGAELSEQRSELLRFADKAEQLFPNEPGSLLLRARLLSTGPSPEQALPLLARIPESSEDFVDAQQLKASILREVQLPATARRVVEATIERVGATPALLRQLGDLQNQSGAQDQSIETRRKLLAGRFDDVGARRVLVADALQRGATAEVLEHIDVMSRLAPGVIDTLLAIASLYDALGRDDMVLATYRKAMDIAPESPEVLVAYGRALLRTERPDLARQAFSRALSLRPQDAPTRELLEQIAPKPRDDEAYATASDKILQMRGDGDGYSNTVLVDLTVNTVFDNGLGSSFHQHAAQVHDEEGARQYRTYPIQYDPDSQRVDLRLARVYRKDGHVLESVRTVEQQLGEPWYRVYYDTRALVVVFSDLEPGDVVELRYRIDDIAHRNLFADYYGDLHVWQAASPIRHNEYVLITPKSRQFYMNEPKLAGLSHNQQIVGDRRIDHYVADNLPAIVAEADMPGVTEVSPYLHVSTYKTWQDVGRWYWGLIKDQLYADESLKRTVAGLMKDAPDLRTKVERIHDWVVQNTRYVGLEFGIHGFLPYRVPLIVQRGFGDCKDKASLLYTMLREAGIDARIVLVRTRHNGSILDQPASLSVFDHAITYVPALDMYLDGTAEHSGVDELPVQDQGVSVLRVGPSDAELHVTPVLDAEHNSKRTRTLKVQLAADGSAVVEGEEVVAGADAAGYRDYYQAPGTRGERFERSLGALYPGLKLETQHFDALDKLQQPVRYSYRIHAPQLAHWSGDELQVEPSVLHDLVQDMARLQQRRHTLDLQGNRVYVEERSVRVPNGMRATDLPAGGEATSPFGRLKLDVTQGGTTITARTELRIDRDHVAKEDYAAFRSWVEAADQLLKQRVGLRKDHE
jgi:tetratricopeptide (TPR) repeat protein